MDGLRQFSILRCHEDLDAVLAKRLLGRIILSSDQGLTFGTTYNPGIFLPFVKISKFDLTKGNLNLNGSPLFQIRPLIISV